VSIKPLFLSITIFLFGIGAHPVLAQPSEKVVESVSPAALLAAFPVVPKTWKCVESKGNTDVSVMGMPITTAVRRYEIPAEDPPKNEIPTTAQEPKTLRIIAMDLGSRFEDPALRAIPPEKSFPLRGLTGEIRSYTGRLLYEGVGEKRLFIQVEAKGFTVSDFRQLLGKLPLEVLIAAEKSFPKTIIPSEKGSAMIGERNIPLITRKMNNIIIDELAPSRNRTWESSTYDASP